MKFDTSKSGEILRTILDSLPQKLYVLNEKLEIQWVNEGAFTVPSGKSDSKRGKRCCYAEILKNGKRCASCPAIKAFRTGRIESAEIKSESGDDHRHLLATAVPLGRNLAGDSPLVLEVVQDITASKQIEEQLRRISEFNSAIIENAPVAIFTIDRKGMFLSVNPALATLSGLGALASEKLLRFNWLENPYTISCGLADYIKRGLQGDPFELWDFPFTSYRGDRNQYIHFRGVPLRGKDGNVEGLLCIIEETTERVRISARLMQEGKMSAVGRLATAIAHELNNPLATLVVHSELACDMISEIERKGQAGAELDELRGYLDVVQDQAFRCKEIVKDLFNLLWRETFEEGITDVNSLLNVVVERKDFCKQGIKLTKELSMDIPLARGDSNALGHVLMNIIQNARDAIEARTAGQIWVRTSSSEDFVIVEIEDNGVGIPAPIADHIFEPFFTTKESNRGMGLGLTVCYDLMKKMGGDIEMQQRQGGGSTFKIRLPVKRSQG
jgi:PAS domain S-box-containing protein